MGHYYLLLLYTHLILHEYFKWTFRWGSARRAGSTKPDVLYTDLCHFAFGCFFVGNPETQIIRFPAQISPHSACVSAMNMSGAPTSFSHKRTRKGMVNLVVRLKLTNVLHGFAFEGDVVAVLEHLAQMRSMH